MNNLNPSAQLEARANREQQKLLRVHDELQRIGDVIKNSDLPPEIKIRLYASLRAENELVCNDQERIASLRKAAEISRSKQWVTTGDK